MRGWLRCALRALRCALGADNEISILDQKLCIVKNATKNTVENRLPVRAMPPWTKLPMVLRVVAKGQSRTPTQSCILSPSKSSVQVDVFPPRPERTFLEYLTIRLDCGFEREHRAPENKNFAKSWGGPDIIQIHPLWSPVGFARQLFPTTQETKCPKRRVPKCFFVSVCAELGIDLKLFLLVAAKIESDQWIWQCVAGMCFCATFNPVWGRANTSVVRLKGCVWFRSYSFRCMNCGCRSFRKNLRWGELTCQYFSSTLDKAWQFQHEVSCRTNSDFVVLTTHKMPQEQHTRSTTVSWRWDSSSITCWWSCLWLRLSRQTPSRSFKQVSFQNKCPEKSCLR